MKKKSLSLLLSGLLTVCLTGVGFASWLIVQGDTLEYSTGEVVVETVVDKKISISAAWKDNKNTFNFTGLQNANTGWLRSDTTTPADLDLTLIVTITNAEYDADGKVDITFTPTDSTKYTAVTNTDKRTDVDGTQTYLVAPTVAATHTIDTTSTEKYTAASGDTPSSYVFEIDIAFSWGTYFGGMNPYTYYNQDGFSYTTHGTEAKNALTDFHTQMSGLAFKVKLETK